MESSRTVEFDWSFIGLVEFLLSDYQKEQKSRVLDVGSGAGAHSELMRAFGYQVQSIDKYAEGADIKEDFQSYQLKDQYDVIFCSHVIEHQRNVGQFLDKIYDTLTDDGVLVMTAPNHPPERIIEGHLAVFPWPLMLQNLIHAGFDCKSGKIISTYETTFIVKKADNFDVAERLESGYQWSEAHQARSPVELKSGSTFKIDGPMLNNCECVGFKQLGPKEMQFGINPKPDYEKQNIVVKSTRFGLNLTL